MECERKKRADLCCFYLRNWPRERRTKSEAEPDTKLAYEIHVIDVRKHQLFDGWRWSVLRVFELISSENKINQRGWERLGLMESRDGKSLLLFVLEDASVLLNINDL